MILFAVSCAALFSCISLFGIISLTLNLKRGLRRMISKEEFDARMDAVDAQLGKATAEIVNEIATLRSQMPSIPPEAEATLQRIEQKAAALDALNDDPPPAGDTTDTATDTGTTEPTA